MVSSKTKSKTPNKKVKTKKNINKKEHNYSSLVTEEQKEFYLDQINALEPRLVKYVYN